MRKLLSLLTAILFVGTITAQDIVYKTATFTSGSFSKGVSGYTGTSFSSTTSGFTVDIENGNNNNLGWNYIKIGGSKGAYTGTITTAAVIDKAITKVDLTIDAITSSNVTSITLYTSTNKSSWTSVGTFAKSTGTKSVAIASPAANLYYKIEVVCTKGSSNGLIQLSEVKYYIAAPKYAVEIDEPSNTNLTVQNAAGSDVATNDEFAAGARLKVTAVPKIANTYRVTPKVYKKNDASTVVAIDGTDSITMPAYAITITADEVALNAVSLAVNDAKMGSATINGGAGPIYASEDDEITLVATPETGYEFVNWTVTVGESTDITINQTTSATTTAGLVTGPVTVTATFQKQSCTNLAAPTEDEVTKTYNSATIAWNAVANAAGYVLNITKHSDASAVLTDELIVAPAVSFEKTGLLGNTQYDYTVMAVGDGETYCDESNPLLESSFTTEDYPAATLTFSENGVDRDLTGSHKLSDVIVLPKEAATGVVGKVLVGWTNKANKNYSGASEPEVFYAKGTNYAIAAIEDTLYAVYAAIVSDDPTTTKLTSNSFDSEATYIIGAAATSGTHYFYSYSAVNTNIWGLMDAIDEETPIEFTVSGTASALKIKDGSNNYVKAVSANFQMSSTEFTLILNADGTIHADLSGTDYNLRYNTDYGLRFYNKATGNSAYLFSIVHNYTYNSYSTTGTVPTAIENIESGEKAVKKIVNGMLIIEKNGHIYNAMGQMIK